MRFLILVGVGFFSFTVLAADLTVEFLEIKNGNGGIAVTLFSEQKAESYPVRSEDAIQKAYVELKGKTKAEVTFKNLDPGFYAVSSFHDEDGDRELETNFLGIPTDGMGASNGARGSFGPPRFEDAKVSVSKGNQKIQISIRY